MWWDNERQGGTKKSQEKDSISQKKKIIEQCQDHKQITFLNRFLKDSIANIKTHRKTLEETSYSSRLWHQVFRRANSIQYSTKSEEVNPDIIYSPFCTKFINMEWNYDYHFPNPNYLSCKDAAWVFPNTLGWKQGNTLDTHVASPSQGSHTHTLTLWTV